VNVGLPFAQLSFRFWIIANGYADELIDCPTLSLEVFANECDVQNNGRATISDVMKM